MSNQIVHKCSKCKFTPESQKHSRKDLDSLGMLKGFHLHGAQLLEANIMDSACFFYKDAR